ncbi:hypothetical protein CCH79_00020695 [Gambusia affinis]|uniref:Peptidase M10A matrix metallopeptidase C-terminal domain-containing protein n=1 Tax=Gambusia affinis TaxID=33528 RepID=A0A315V6Z3_GAMAF|nr:hypothetical protein CCH79_00020695 [Gambusia affinis]
MGSFHHGAMVATVLRVLPVMQVAGLIPTTSASVIVSLDTSPALPDHTYFYRGKEYWRFDNQKLTVEPGYPKSILKDWMGCYQSEMERSGSNRGDRQLPLDDVDVIVTINDVPTTVNAIAVVIPCILSLCILVLIYTIFQFKSKGAQQNTMMQLYYKYPVQEWNRSMTETQIQQQAGSAKPQMAARFR